MKIPFLLAAAAGIPLLVFAQDDPPQDSTAERLKALEDEVTLLRRDLAQVTAVNEEVVRYLAAEKTRGAAILKALDESEAAGFTAGINYRSREILLAGLRDYIMDAQTGLPGAKKAAEPASTAR